MILETCPIVHHTPDIIAPTKKCDRWIVQCDCTMLVKPCDGHKQKEDAIACWNSFSLSILKAA